LEFASERIKDSTNIVKTAICNQWIALKFASKRLRDLESLVLIAVK
jgi:hypothetical protein